MKNILTTVLAMLGLCSMAVAQQSKGIEFGVGIGLNGATIIDNNSDRAKVKAGFNVAVSADNYFSDRWSLKGKVIYDQKGTRSSTQYSGDIGYDSDISLKYLTLPVMANWHFGKTRNWYLNFGPYAGFLLNATRSRNFAGLQGDRSISGSCNSVDAGLAYGIGVKLPVAKKAKFYIEFDGQDGVLNIFKNRTSVSRNSRGSFNIGLNF